MATALCDRVLFESAPAIDESAGVLKHVKVLGRVSKRGYEYSESAMAQACKLYEGVQVFLDHPDERQPGTVRNVGDHFGWLRNPVIESDGVYADFNYLKSHPYASRFIEVAQRNPRQLGFSHNANGDKVRRSGKTFVESVDKVKSVDLVSRPATTAGLWESDPMQKTVREIIEACSLPGRDKVLALFEEEGPMAGMAEQPVEAPAEVDSEAEVKAAFGKMIMSAFEDDSLDMKATLAKIKDILKAHEKLTGKAEAPAGGSEGGDDDSEPAKESHVELNKRLRALESERDSLKADKAARTLIESLDREPVEALVKAVALLPSEAERKSLIEGYAKRVKFAPKPARSVPLQESEKVKPVASTKEFAASLR